MITLHCQTKNEFKQVLTKLHKEGYKVEGLPDVVPSTEFDRYITINGDRFNWSSDRPDRGNVTPATEFLFVLITE